MTSSPFPEMPVWVGPCCKQLEANSEAALHRSAAILPQDIRLLHSQGTQDISRFLTMHTRHESTRAIAEDGAPSFGIVEKGPLWTGFTRLPQTHVRKSRHDARDEAMEYRLLREYRRLGFPVPEALLAANEILVQHLGLPLTEIIFWQGFEGIGVEDLGMRMMDILSDFDAALGDILLDGEKEHIRARNLESLPRRLSAWKGSSSPTEEYSLRIAAAVPGADNYLLPITADTVAKLASARAIFPCFSADIQPKNLYLQGEDLYVGDLCPIKECSMQDADATALDAYVPLRSPASVLPGKGMVRSDESVQALVMHRIAAWEHKIGQPIDTQKYLTSLPAARFFVNLRNAHSSMTRLARSPTYQEIASSAKAALHHLDIALGCAETDALAQYVAERYEVAFESAIPSRILDAAEEWARR